MKLCKLETRLRVCMTVPNAPNCKHIKLHSVKVQHGSVFALLIFIIVGNILRIHSLKELSEVTPLRI